MRFALIIAVTLIRSGCSGDTDGRLPTAPDPPPQTTPPSNRVVLAWVWVVVIGEYGWCVPSATVEIVSGQGLGRKVTQMDPCSYWDPDFAAVFKDLIPGDEVTLRASAPGYTVAEKTVMRTLGGQTAHAFELSKIQ